MRWWFCLPLLLLGVIACGGGSSPAPTPAANVACGGELPTEDISFRGRIAGFDHPTPTVPGTIDGVEIAIETADINLLSQTVGIGNRWFAPGSTAWVSLPGDDWPDFEVGDCVVGWGRVAGFSCSGPGFPGACDAIRSEAKALDIVEHRAESADVPGCQALSPSGAPASPRSVVFSGPLMDFKEIDDAPEGWPRAVWSFSIDSSDALPPNETDIASSAGPFEMKLVTDDGWPGESSLRPGDCVYGSATLRRYECGPHCDAAGYVIDKMRLRLG